MRWHVTRQTSVSYLCLCRSSMYASCWYSLAAVQLTVCRMVLRDPSRMVPPCGRGEREWEWGAESRGMGSENTDGQASRRTCMCWRLPSLLSPTLCVVLPSGMKTTAGLRVLASNSVLFAPSLPSTLRANSITAICMPRQMPRYGTCKCGGGGRRPGRGSEEDRDAREKDAAQTFGPMVFKQPREAPVD